MSTENTGVPREPIYTQGLDAPPEWQTPLAETIQDIESRTKLIGEMMVKDFEANQTITQDVIYAILPHMSVILGKKELL